MLNIHHAISAVALFVTMGVLLFTHGSMFVQLTVLWGLLIGGMGQYVAQDDTIPSKMVGVVFTYIAMLLAFVGIIIYTIQLA